MTTFTKSDLASRALRQPGLYGPDETVSGADQEDAETVCESLVETLAEMGVSIPNGSVDLVPGGWFIPLAQFMGLYLLQSFGGPAPTREQVDGAISPLRRMSVKTATQDVLVAEYF